MQTLLNLLAGVSLLVWGTHIVRTGILRVYGGDLRRALRRSVSKRGTAFIAGLGVTGLIQSSTATALIVASFAGQGLIGTAPALAVMLGADVGTSVVTVLLSFDLSWLAPLLIFVGVVLFLSRQSTTPGRFGRILIGLGLIMFALQWISVAARPMVQAAGVKVIFASLTGDVMLDMLVSAMFTVLCFSSLAVVLLVATLASLHVIALPVALGLVLGANLGSGVLGMISTLHTTPEARRVTLGNFLFKLIGCILALPLVGHLESWIGGLGLDEAREVVLFHLFFNVMLALLLMGFTERIAGVAERLLPSRPASDDPAKPRHLDPSALETPTLAISYAAREALRIGDVIEQMLSGVLTVLTTNDRGLAQQLKKLDDVVDELYTAVKLYLTQISREALDEKEGRRWADIVSFAINMEQIGDIIERIITELEDKRMDKGRKFSDAGMAEIVDLHARLMANLRLGLSVFLNRDLKSAQELLAQKVLFRDLERAYANSHLGRLTSNTVDSIETSSLHLDLISDLRRINSHICSIAYPILEEAGVLARTRLKTADETSALAAVADHEVQRDSWQKGKPTAA
ncbi:MAG TPA: Na/Pi cotransporter family protein [Casimicrobiaceae bacterium]|jgi:phosphate:Na+ symporter|nr:Na/Pi cotransporter family protein [Casimicrobiaceae bacterium]